ncbi:MAG TPA: TIGR04282 family arsenosugar biosynthesis glycosyltransferase [Saprospiraceae bacterium]|nr:TIGR04282 family arsenosugar biosynthesis glycosyltransferase [Saprospiraceae bacterium]
MHSTLLIFIRNPQSGKVKTRLARTAGDAEALRIYHILLKKTRAAALGVQAERWLFYSDFINQNDEWPETDFSKKIQANGDLGERMEQAFRQAFEAGAKKVVIIGSDCPELTGEILQRAFDKLDEADFVLGPASDGGYYLLGMKELEASVFHGIEWSTETVRARTLEKIQAAGKSCALLPVLSDVDTEEDWRSVQPL